jgi:hypothetical protein
MANDDSILKEINTFPMHYMQYYVNDYKSTERTDHDRAAMRSALIERETGFWSSNIQDSAKLKVIEYFDSHPGAAHHAEELVTRAAIDESTLVMYADGRQETRGQHESRLGAETAREGLHVGDGNFVGALVLGISQLIHPDLADALHHAEPFLTAGELLTAHGEALESRAHVDEMVHAGLGYDGPSPLIPGIGGYEAGNPHPVEHEAEGSTSLPVIPEPTYAAGTASARDPSLAGDGHDLRDSGASTGHGHTSHQSSSHHSMALHEHMTIQTLDSGSPNASATPGHGDVSHNSMALQEHMTIQTLDSGSQNVSASSAHGDVSHHSMALPEHREGLPADASSGTSGPSHGAGHHGGHVHPADGLPWVNTDHLLSHHSGGAHPIQHEPSTHQHHGMSLVEHIDTHTPLGSDSVPPHDATPHDVTPHHSNTYDQHLANEHGGH